jgi:hypothetical protein
MIRKIEPYTASYHPYGTLYPLQRFLELNELRKITPEKGTIGEVVINGYVTNILIQNWNMYQIDEEPHIMSLRALEDTGGIVELLWIEKK